MPNFSKLACLAIATAVAYSTADAASLRTSTSTSKSLVSSLSTAHVKALKALTTKYDCDLGATDLVSTLKEVTSKSHAADKALTTACANYQASYEKDLAAKLGEADTLANSAPAKGDAVYAAAEKVALDEFKKIETKHEALVADATSVVEAATKKHSLAQGEAQKKNYEKNAARALFEEQTQNANDAAEAEKSVLRAARDASNEAARTNMEDIIRQASDKKRASDAECKSAFDTRMSLITTDEHVVYNEIKPLLDQLRACNSVSAGTSFLEVKVTETKTKCEKSARNRLQHLQQSLLQVSLNIAETPAKEVTGNMADWESRLAMEKTFSENVRKACEDEALGILKNVTAAAQNVNDNARNSANTLCSEEEAKVDAATLAHLTPLKKIADDTEGPAFAADAALKTASEELDKARARHEAAVELKASSISEAEESKIKALGLAENAKQNTVSSTMEAAETIRRTAHEDKEKKSTAKTNECNAEHERLSGERDLVARIQAKISTLTTVRDDETGEVDDCAGNPCQNGATCTDKVNDYECTCKDGFKGKNCEINIDDCNPDPCKNGAACLDGVNDYTCECHPGWSGKDCEINIDDCETNPCRNDATCTDQVNDYVCSCKIGFTGKNCETNVDDCAGSPCKNGGTCHDDVNAYHCECHGDWKGSNCEEPKTPPCKTINEPRFHGGNLACDWPNVGTTLQQVCRENGYNHVKNWQRNGRRVDCYGWRGRWHHDSNPGYVRQITCCK